MWPRYVEGNAKLKWNPSYSKAVFTVLFMKPILANRDTVPKDRLRLENMTSLRQALLNGLQASTHQWFGQTNEPKPSWSTHTISSLNSFNPETILNRSDSMMRMIYYPTRVINWFRCDSDYVYRCGGIASNHMRRCWTIVNAISNIPFLSTMKMNSHLAVITHII